MTSVVAVATAGARQLMYHLVLLTMCLILTSHTAGGSGGGGGGVSAERVQESVKCEHHEKNEHVQIIQSCFPHVGHLNTAVLQRQQADNYSYDDVCRCVTTQHGRPAASAGQQLQL